MAWLTPDEALNRLSHPAERELLQRHATEFPTPVTEFVSSQPPRSVPFLSGLTGRFDPQLDRLRARLQTAREHLEGCIQRLDEDAVRHPARIVDRWWLPSVRRSLSRAEAALHRRDLDGGWGALHDAERFTVFGLKDVEVVTRAVSLRTEAQKKLGVGWRAQTVEVLLGPLNLKDCLKAGGSLNQKERLLLEHALVESLAVVNESSDNIYHRMHLVGQQLKFLVVVCAFILAATLGGSYLLASPDSVYGWGQLTAVALAGALGGVVSAMFQLSRVGEAKIPDALLYGLITTGRPILGAGSALFIYFVMQAKLISFLNAPADSSLEVGVVVGFVAGFSERIVLKAVDKVAGADKGNSDSGKDRVGSGGESGSSARTTAKSK